MLDLHSIFPVSNPNRLSHGILPTKDPSVISAQRNGANNRDKKRCASSCSIQQANVYWQLVRRPPKPVFDLSGRVATAKVANKGVFVSPTACENQLRVSLRPAPCHLASRVSVRVPIWLNLISNGIGKCPFWILRNQLVLVTNRSSPTQ